MQASSETAVQVYPAAPLFIVMNAGSGHGDAPSVRAVIEERLQAAQRKYRLALVEEPPRLHEIAADAVRNVQASGGVIVVAGGDGTINAVANAAYATDCPFGVLPQGTFNYFSRVHGIPLDTAGAVDALLTSRAHPVQVGLVNERVFLVNASLGLYPELLEDREVFKRRLGRNRWVALVSGLVTVIRHHKELKLEIEYKDKPHRMRTPTLFVGNNTLQLEQIGIHEAPALEHGRLVALMVRTAGKLELLWLAARGALGSLGEAEEVVSFAFTRITVRPRGRIRRLKVAADGEIFRLDAPIKFEVAPKPLLLLKPEPRADASKS